MPVISGLIAGITALEAAGAGLASAAGASAAAATGGVAAAGAAGTAAGITAGSIGGAAALGGSTAAATAGTLAATTAATSVGTTAATLGGVGTALSLGSTGIQTVMGMQAAAEQQKQEEIRQKQMLLESARQRRDVINKSQVASALGVNNAANSGMAIDGGSAIAGITGQAAGNAGYAINSINENQNLSTAMFKSNAAESNYNTASSLFGGVGDIGKTIAGTNMQTARLGTTLFAGT